MPLGRFDERFGSISVNMAQLAMEREAEAVAGGGNRGRYYRSTAPLAGSEDDASGKRPYDVVLEQAPPAASSHSWRNPAQLDAVYGFAAAGGGAEAVSTLLWLLRGSEQWPVAAAAATALGEMGAVAAPAARHLTDSLMHRNEWVARAAAEALGTVAVRVGDGIGEVAIALAYTVEEDRAVTPWSLALTPLKESAACGLSKLLLVPGASAVAAARAKETLLKRKGEEVEGMSPYVRQWLTGGEGPRARL